MLFMLPKGVNSLICNRDDAHPASSLFFFDGVAVWPEGSVYCGYTVQYNAEQSGHRRMHFRQSFREC